MIVGYMHACMWQMYIIIYIHLAKEKHTNFTVFTKTNNWRNVTVGYTLTVNFGSTG